MSVCPLEANLQMSSCPLEAVHTLGTYGHLTVRIVHGTYGHLTVPGTYGHLPVQTVPGTYGHLTVRTASMGHTDISLYEQCYSVTNQQTETTHIYIEIINGLYKSMQINTTLTYSLWVPVLLWYLIQASGPVVCKKV